MGSLRESPASDIPSDSGVGTMSIRDKTLLKRNISKHHNNNMSAGYVSVHEEALHKTGLRGRKTYLFWTLVGLVCLLASINMILTVFILRVLRLGNGMESLEIIPEDSLIKFHGITDLGRVLKRYGNLQGFKDEPVELSSRNGSINVDIQWYPNKTSRILWMQENGTHFSGVENFKITHPKTAKNVFSTKMPNFGFPHGVRNVNVNLATTRKISSPVNEKLLLRSDTLVHLKGNEGTKIEGKEIIWSADQFIFLRSVNGSIVLSSHQGVSIDTKAVPIIGTGSVSGLPVVGQYKVCVCMPEGKLFRVPVHAGQSSHIACNNLDFSADLDPCK